MKTNQNNTYTAFLKDKLIISGSLSDVVLKIKNNKFADGEGVLIFSDDTGKTMDFNFQGTKQDVLKRLEVFVSNEDDDSTAITGPGRPKLGVISREVSLLPRHWEWLANQPGGASATLRLLVEEAKKKSQNTPTVKQVQERVYKVMSVLAGDLQGYEEALRALYKKDTATLFSYIEQWPKDIQKYLKSLGEPIFEE